MKRFAANRVCKISDRLFLRNQVVEVDETTHLVQNVFTLDGEIRQTEWIGGMILLTGSCPARESGECFASFLERLYASSFQECPLHAYHITAFDVNSMEFTAGSRIILL